MPHTQTGMRQLLKVHHPVDDPIDRTRLLRERFGELGPVVLQFIEGLLAKQILADFTTLRIPVSADQFDAALTDAEQNGYSQLAVVAPVRQMPK